MITWKSRWVGLTLMALTAQAWAEEPGVAIKQDDIKAEPFKDAKSVGAVKKGETVTILDKRSGWLQIKAAEGSGWVRILSVRKGTAGGGGAASEIAGVAGVATGRSGTGQVVSTTGVRGLGEEDLKSAKFNEEELKKAEAAGINADEAKQFAAQGDLTARQVGWLPVPKTNSERAR